MDSLRAKQVRGVLSKLSPSRELPDGGQQDQAQQDPTQQQPGQPPNQPSPGGLGNQMQTPGLLPGQPASQLPAGPAISPGGGNGEGGNNTTPSRRRRKLPMSPDMTGKIK